MSYPSLILRLSFAYPSLILRSLFAHCSLIVRSLFVDGKTERAGKAGENEG